MTTNNLWKRLHMLYFFVSILGLASVSIISILDPQQTMDLVQVKLENTDAISSIRGIYGGVGCTIIVGLIYLQRQLPFLALAFLTMFWSSYALSRYLTMAIDGPLQDFGNQWVLIETILAVLGLGLVMAQSKNRLTTSARN
ncbi:DUF4345 domain-containing protein [Dyadobacter tibetensis]|uniref:DUF4345 domain-containing protein n=1 Tax=Dyadobacter tibetensis TaxID=1211851 RepID=UPI00046F27C9|nr:DUF4345 domain-containing protein [Dyadobacter tibetensis]